MKKGKFLILGVVLTLFTCSFVSCLDDDNNDYKNLLRFIYEPVLVKSVDDSNVMETQYGDILAPQLSQAKAGEYYLTSFWVDTTYRPYAASELEYIRMGADTLNISTVGTSIISDSEYNSRIADVGIYLQDEYADALLKLKDGDTEPVNQYICIDSTFFIAASFDAGETEIPHEFKFVTLASELSDTPTLYLMAKTTKEAIARKGYALNFSTLMKYSGFIGKKEVTFNLKYKSGVDAEGKSVYSDYKHNPVTLKIK